jgi:hypothetical protein
MFSKKILFTLAIASFTFGCASNQGLIKETSLNAGAEKVKLVKEEPRKEDKCEFLGDVTGSQGDWFRGAFTSNESLETGARNELKNKAYAKGGNLAVLLTERSSATDKAQTHVTLTANVYKCPQ